MTDQSPSLIATQEQPKDSYAQTLVALAIVAGLVILGGLALGAAIIIKDAAAAMVGIAGTCIGALATALNAPTGIANVISSASRKPVP